MVMSIPPTQPTIECAHCGGTIPVGALECLYCGSKQDRDGALLKYAAESEKLDRQCPECECALESYELKLTEAFQVERCPECYGVFFDKSELQAFLNSVFNMNDKPDIARLNELLRCPDKVQQAVMYRNCPECAQMMTRKNFGHRTGVIIDTCYHHGTWLDGGELSQLVKWASAGGQNISCYFEDRNKILRQDANKRKAEALAERERYRTRGFLFKF